MWGKIGEVEAKDWEEKRKERETMVGLGNIY